MDGEPGLDFLAAGSLGVQVPQEFVIRPVHHVPQVLSPKLRETVVPRCKKLEVACRLVLWREQAEKFHGVKRLLPLGLRSD